MNENILMQSQQQHTKKCNKCNEILDRSNFSPSGGGTYLRPECRKCNYKLAKERKELKEKYGSAPVGYICPICLRGEDELIGTGGNAGTWTLDHNHKTKEFRGFLCHSCNRGVGAFKDDINMMMRAIQYLNKP